MQQRRDLGRATSSGDLRRNRIAPPTWADEIFGIGKSPFPPFVAHRAFRYGQDRGHVARRQHPVGEGARAGYCAMLRARPIVRPLARVRAFTCRRAREGRDGTTGGRSLMVAAPRSSACASVPGWPGWRVRFGVLPEVPVKLRALSSGYAHEFAHIGSLIGGLKQSEPQTVSVHASRGLPQQPENYSNSAIGSPGDRPGTPATAVSTATSSRGSPARPRRIRGCRPGT